MKKVLILVVCNVIMLNVSAFAETKNESVPIEDSMAADTELNAGGQELEYLVYNNTIYVPKHKSDVRAFVGLETGIVSYHKVTTSYDLGFGGDIVQKETEFNLNHDILNNVSLLVGAEINDTVRLALNIIQNNTETKIDNESEELQQGAYGITLDGFITKNKYVSPFLRLGVGLITIENEDMDFAAMQLLFGLGVNYQITDNVFSYGVLEYSLVPETEIDDTEADIKFSGFALSVGLGYRF